MLKQRVLTGLLLAPLIGLLVLWLDTPWLALLLSAFTLLAAWEWTPLAGLRRESSRIVFLLLTLGLLSLAYLALNKLGFPLMLLALPWWLLALYWVLAYERGGDPLPRGAWLKSLAGWLILLPAWSAMLLLHREHDPAWLLFLLIMVWLADSGAYFAGRRWGRRKLAPRVSPGKTLAGVGGALAITAPLAVGYAWWLQKSWLFLGGLLALSLFSVMVSILGDLVESLFKRAAEIKDSGHILPGHGGILDRVDSLTAAAPVFSLGLCWLENSL